MKNNLFKAFRIGQQGEVVEAGFLFKARKDCEPIILDEIFDFSKVGNDVNQSAQIGMMRYANSFLRNLHVAVNDEVSKSDYEHIELILNIDRKFDVEKLALDPMVCGERLLKLVFLYYEIIKKRSLKIQDYLLEYIVKSRNKLAVHLLKSCKQANNHTLQGAHAIYAEAFYANKNDLMRDAIARIEDILKILVGPDGFWQENSAEYHLYGIQLLREMNSGGWYKETKLEEYLSLLLKNSQLIFASNDGDAFAFGDTDRSLLKSQIKKGVHSFPSLKMDQNTIDCADGILTSRLHKQGFISSVCAINFYHSKFHKHNDNLSFEWYFRDKFIVLDPGKFTYQNGVSKNYSLCYKSHNTIDLSCLNHDSILSHKRISGGCDVEGEHHILMSLDQDNFSVSREIKHTATEITILDRIYLAPRHSLERLTASINLHPSFSESQILNNEIWFEDENRFILKIKTPSPFLIYKGSEVPFMGWYGESYQNLKELPLVVFDIPVENRIYAEFNLIIEIQ